MTSCAKLGCTNEPDMYSRFRLCTKHQKIRERDLRIAWAMRLFTIMMGVPLVIGLIQAQIGITSYLTSYFFLLYQFGMILLGLVGFVIFYRRTQLPYL